MSYFIPKAGDMIIHDGGILSLFAYSSGGTLALLSFDDRYASTRSLPKNITLRSERNIKMGETFLLSNGDIYLGNVDFARVSKELLKGVFHET